MSLVISSFPFRPWIGGHYDEARLASEFQENHSVRPSALWAWKWKGLWARPGWHGPWLIMETLFSDAADSLGCRWVHLLEESLILTAYHVPWHMGHGELVSGPRVVLFYFLVPHNVQCVKRQSIFFLWLTKAIYIHHSEINKDRTRRRKFH